MSCLSRLVGLVCAVVPGLLFLAFSARFFFLWPSLGFVVGPLYSLVSLITGIVCLYLGLTLLLESRPNEENVASINAIAETPVPAMLAPEPVAAPMPEPLAAPMPVAPLASETENSTSSIFAKTNEIGVEPQRPIDTPESRIRQLAATRPQWQATAPQLAHLANLNMGVADATARAMADNGDAQIQTGPNGETVYLFDLASENTR